MTATTSSRFFLLGLSLILGIVLGQILTNQVVANKARSSSSQAKSLSAKSSTKRSGPSLRIPQPIRNDLRALSESDSYSASSSKLLRQARSPLRVDSLLNFQLEEECFATWQQRLADGEVTRPEEFARIAARLAREDPERALELLLKYKIDFQTLDNLYAYRNSMYNTIVAMNQSLLIFEGLKGMKRGGAQQDNSLFFSRAWAMAHPAQAATHFEELVKLRNMNSARSANLNYKGYGRELISSWVKKDSDAAAAFVANYPDGPAKEALASSLARELEKKQENQK